MEKLTPEMKQTLVTVPDLSEQPKGEYILITGGMPKPVYYFVDGYYLRGENVICFYRKSPDDREINVYTCRVREGLWALAATDAVHQVTKEDYVRHMSQDGKDTTRVLETIDPEAFAEAEKLVREHSEVPTTAVERPIPGQYL